MDGESYRDTHIFGCQFYNSYCAGHWDDLAVCMGTGGTDFFLPRDPATERLCNLHLPGRPSESLWVWLRTGHWCPMANPGVPPWPGTRGTVPIYEQMPFSTQGFSFHGSPRVTRCTARPFLHLVAHEMMLESTLSLADLHSPL